MRCQRSIAIVSLTILLAGFIVADAGAQTPDPFNPGTTAVSGDVRALALQPDGKILVGGSFTQLGGVTRNRIARINTDGTLDTTFNPGANNSVLAIAVQADGKIVIGGQFTAIGGVTGTTTRLRIGRLNGDGSVDTGFDPGANLIAAGIVGALAIQPNGKILVGGTFTALGGGTGTTTRNRIGRLNADGSVDTFNPGANIGTVEAVVLQPDGRILVGGTFTALGGGTGTTTRSRIGRLEANGTVDLTFDPGAGGTVLAISVQADGGILVGGSFQTLGGGGAGTGFARNRIGRINADGALDTTFNPGANNTVNALAVQADGRILAGGLFTMLGGGGTGTTPRNRIARLAADGIVDATFDPSVTGSPTLTVVRGLALQPDGRVLVGGTFTGIGAVPRENIGRLFNTDQPAQTLTSTANSVTWMRGGAAPEVSWAEFSTSVDGVTYTPLGVGSRIPGGWELNFITLPVDVNLRVRARGFYNAGYATGSSSIVEQWVPGSGTNIITNGDFGSGMTSWLTFDGTMVFNLTGGVFQYYRAGPSAVVFQQTGVAVAADTPLTAQFSVGNADTIRKRLSVLVHDADFSDLHVCTFWLPANAPMLTYTMRTHNTKAWTSATISIYAASTNAPANTTGFYQLDNVALYVPAGPATETTCHDPRVPVTPSGAAIADLIVNGGFTGVLAPWTTFGQIQGQIAGDVFEFIKLAGTPAGVVLQATGQPVTANQILTAEFELGNSSAVRKRVTAIVHDNDFSDLAACTFWLPPGQPLTPYRIRMFTTKAWANTTVSIYPATVGAAQWIRLDNVSLTGTPSATTVGTECAENASAGPPPVWTGGGAVAGSTVRPFASAQADAVKIPHRAAGAAAWMTAGSHNGSQVVRLAEPLDLTGVSNARLTLRFWLPAPPAQATVEVSTDGGDWEIVRLVESSDGWTSVEVDLAAYVGEVILVRVVLDGAAPAGGSSVGQLREDFLRPSFQRDVHHS